MVWSLELRRCAKTAVVAAFLIRLLVVVPVVLRLYYIQSTTYNTLTNSLTRIAIATQVALHFSIAGTTFPFIRQVISCFDAETPNASLQQIDSEDSARSTIELASLPPCFISLSTRARYI